MVSFRRGRCARLRTPAICAVAQTDTCAIVQVEVIGSRAEKKMLLDKSQLLGEGSTGGRGRVQRTGTSALRRHHPGHCGGRSAAGVAARGGPRVQLVRHMEVGPRPGHNDTPSHTEHRRQPPSTPTYLAPPPQPMPPSPWAPDSPSLPCGRQGIHGCRGAAE